MKLFEPREEGVHGSFCFALFSQRRGECEVFEQAPLEDVGVALERALTSLQRSHGFVLERRALG